MRVDDKNCIKSCIIYSRFVSWNWNDFHGILDRQNYGQSLHFYELFETMIWF